MLWRSRRKFNYSSQRLISNARRRALSKAAASTITGSSSVTLQDVSTARAKAWVQIADASGNRTTSSVTIPSATGTVAYATITGTSSVTLANASVSQTGTTTTSVTGASSVTLAAISTARAKAWVQIADAAGNRTTSSVVIPNATGIVTTASSITGTSSVTLANVSTARAKAWVQIADGAGNRTTSSVVISAATGQVTSAAIVGSSSVTLAGISRSQTGTMFAGLTLVTLEDPLYVGPGSILDPAYWTGDAPAAGDQVYFPTNNGFSIATNGEISATASAGTYIVYYNDGTGWYEASVTLDVGRVGSHGVTLANATNSGAGVVIITGIESNVLANVTNNATGGVAIAGSSSVTLANVVPSSTGDVAVAGTSSITLANVTNSATGSATVTGSSSTILDNVVQTASGVVLSGLTGNSSVTLESLAVSQTGSVAALGSRTGNSNVTTDNLIVDQTGIITTPARTADSTITLDNVANTGAGNVVVLGTSAVALDNYTGTGTGGTAITGASSPVLGIVVPSATGTLPLDGNSAVTIADVVGAGSTSSAVTGTSNVTLTVVSTDQVGYTYRTITANVIEQSSDTSSVDVDVFINCEADATETTHDTAVVSFSKTLDINITEGTTDTMQSRITLSGGTVDSPLRRYRKFGFSRRRQ